MELTRNLTEAQVNEMRQKMLDELLFEKTKLSLRSQFENPFDIPRVITVQPNSTQPVTQFSVQIASDADVRMLGYNISYTLPQSGVNALSLALLDSNKGIPFSSDRVPLDLISTPGQLSAGANGTRFGFRHFPYHFSKNSEIQGEIQNDTDEELEVRIVFYGIKLKYLSGLG